MPVCPTCGSVLEYDLHYAIADASTLLNKLDAGRGDRQREVYVAQDGNWHLTFGGGPVDPAVVSKLVREGALNRVYSNSDGAYWLGRTIDLEASMERRRLTGNRKALVYVEDMAHG